MEKTRYTVDHFEIPEDWESFKLELPKTASHREKESFSMRVQQCFSGVSWGTWDGGMNWAFYVHRHHGNNAAIAMMQLEGLRKDFPQLKCSLLRVESKATLQLPEDWTTLYLKLHPSTPDAVQDAILTTLRRRFEGYGIEGIESGFLLRNELSDLEAVPPGFEMGQITDHVLLSVTRLFEYLRKHKSRSEVEETLLKILQKFPMVELSY